MNIRLPTFAYPFHISCAVASGNTLFLGTYRNSNENEPDNCIRSLNRDYRENWKCPVEFSPVKAVATPDRVLAVTYDILRGSGYLYCLNRITGGLLWKKRLRSQSLSSELLVFNETVLCFGTEEIAGYSIKNGKRLCAVDYGTSFAPRVRGGSVICCSHYSVAKFRLNDLGMEWIVKDLHYARAFGCDMEHVYVAGEEEFFFLDLKTGRRTGLLKSEAYSPVLCDDQHLFFQSNHDNFDNYVVACFSKQTSKAVWRTNVPISRGDGLYSPQVEILTDQVVIVRANVGPVYTLDRETGKLTMLLSEGSMPDNVFPLQNSPILFLFQNRLTIQYQGTMYLLAEFPSAQIGSKILDADKESWMNVVS